MERVLALVGPTASGKSVVALELAQRLDAEIVSADSRQVYRYMDIGTAKPSLADRAVVPHHLIDIVDPDDTFTLTRFRSAALAAINDIQSRGKLPLIVGGTGLYVRALLQGFVVPPAPPDTALRQALEARAAAEGTDALYRELAAIDPEGSSRIDPANTRRIVRALEVWRTTGKPFSYWQQRAAPPFEVALVGLTCDRTELYRRIDGRVDQMLASGLLQEVEGLAARGYGWELSSMSGLGYRQLGEHLRGECDLPSAVQRIKYATHRYARQQYAWLRAADTALTWFQAEGSPSLLADAIMQTVGGSPEELTPIAGAQGVSPNNP